LGADTRRAVIPAIFFSNTSGACALGALLIPRLVTGRRCRGYGLGVCCPFVNEASLKEILEQCGEGDFGRPHWISSPAPRAYCSKRRAVIANSSGIADSPARTAAPPSIGRRLSGPKSRRQRTGHVYPPLTIFRPSIHFRRLPARRDHCRLRSGPQRRAPLSRGVCRCVSQQRNLSLRCRDVVDRGITSPSVSPFIAGSVPATNTWVFSGVLTTGAFRLAGMISTNPSKELQSSVNGACTCEALWGLFSPDTRHLLWLR
jgi:hypothetical protein